jgi:hypothetical protein
MKRTTALGAVAWMAAAALSTPAAAVSVGQVDTFEDGTTQGWLVGLLGATSPAPPANQASGGPAGADDNFLLLTAIGGVGAGNRLVVINLGQWAGDYTAAGVTAIRMDLRNLGDTELSLRMFIENPTAGPPTDTAFSTTPFVLAPGSGWQSAVFPIAAADLTAGAGSVATALSTATAIRIFHSAAAGFPGEPIVAQLGVDNITAVPEPGAAWLMGLGLAGLAAGAVRRRR